MNFVGNVEGRDFIPSPVDVIVTDGFTGNVALKTLEGGLKFVFSAVLDAIGTNEATKAAGDVLLEHLWPVASQLTPESQGGAMLLGVQGICIISHGDKRQVLVLERLPPAAHQGGLQHPVLRVAAEVDAGDVVAKLAATIRPD